MSESIKIRIGDVIEDARREKDNRPMVITSLEPTVDATLISNRGGQEILFASGTLVWEIRVVNSWSLDRVIGAMMLGHKMLPDTDKERLRQKIIADHARGEIEYTPSE
jgi:hypothetical protein